MVWRINNVETQELLNGNSKLSWWYELLLMNNKFLNENRISTTTQIEKNTKKRKRRSK